jgi:hypothetical protein
MPSLGYHCAGMIAECVNDPQAAGRLATCESWDSGQFALEGECQDSVETGSLHWLLPSAL